MAHTVILRRSAYIPVMDVESLFSVLRCTPLTVLLPEEAVRR